MKLKSLIPAPAIKKALGKALSSTFLLLPVLGITLVAQGQVYPGFPTATRNSTAVLEYGASITQFGSSLYPNALMMIYVSGSQPNNLAFAYSNDGTNYVDTGSIVDYVSGQRFNVNCTASTPATCGVAVLGYNTTAYIAFADQTTHGLDIVQATRVANNAGFQFHLIRQDNSVLLSSAPAMAIGATGNLIIRYGTTQAQNNTYSTVLQNGAFSVYTSSQTGYAPTQSAMVLFNGTLYAIDKQNNSDNGVFVSQLNSLGQQVTGSAYQVPGWYTKLGISAVVYKGAIVAAFQGDGSDNDLWIFSSTNGSTWAGQQYTNNAVGASPTITNFNNGVALAYRANDSSHALYSAWGQ